MDTVVEILRALKVLLYSISGYEIWGVPIDMALHFLAAFGLFAVLRRWFSFTQSIVLIVGAIFFKEIVDVFAKSRAEYIQPPALDAVGDLLFGVLGLVTACLVLDRHRGTEPEHAPRHAIFMPAVISVTALFFMIVGMGSSSHVGLLMVYAGLTVALLLLFPKWRHLVPFAVLPFGALLNVARPLGDIYIYPVEIFILVFAALYPWLLSAEQRARFQFDFVSRLLVVLCAIVTLGAVVRGWEHGVLVDEARVVRPYFLGVVLFYMLWLAQTQGRDYLLALQAGMLFALTGVVGFALAECGYHFLSTQRLFCAPNALFRDTEPLAIYLSVALPFVFASSRAVSLPWWRVLSYLSVVSGLIVLMFTRSRAGLVAVCVVVIVYLLLRAKYQPRRYSLAYFVFAGVVLFMMGWVIVLKTADYLAPGEALWRVAFDSRQAAWAAGVEYIKGAPLIGNGAIENVYNLYLQMAAYFGLPMLVVFLFLIGRVFYASVLGREPTLGLMLGLIGVLTVGFAQSPWGNEFAYLNWLLLFTLFFVSGTAKAREP